MLRAALARGRSLWRGVRRRADVEADMEEEFRLHRELRAADLVRQGMTPEAAARQAKLEFGCTELHKDDARAARGLRPFDGVRVSWLDFKLGFRMLRKYPGLTIVGGLATAFAIWVGAGSFELVRQLVSPSLPLAGGDRVVGLRLWDAAANRREDQLLHDFVAWRDELRSVRDLGAFRTLERNLVTGPGRGAPVEVAEISASAFRVARVPALLGRALVPADEQPGAPPVAVIGHDLWRARFAGDPGVVGRTVRLGSAPTTIVGVMPRGFAFPIAQSLWTPLRVSPLDHQRRQGPGLRVFGRLADGHSLADARAELETFGKRAAALYPDTHEHLRAQVLPYAKSIIELSGWWLVATASANVPGLLLLVLVCANVALLTFARAATREGELTVRTALGAGRGRIVTQLFAEALVLNGLAAAAGLAAAGVGLRWVISVVEAEFLHGGRVPFWFRDQLSPTTVLYTALLTVLGAVIAGVVPALKVTRGMGARLKQASAGGGGLRFGGIWTAVIVAQIAITLAFPVVTLATHLDAQRIRTMKVGFPSAEYLSLRLEMDPEDADGASADTSRAAFVARYARAYQELERRVAGEPGVTGVAFANRLPRTYHPHRLIDVDEGEAAPLDPRWPAYRVSSALVGPGFFDALSAPVVTGRGFTASEHAAERGVPGDSGARGGPVVVNQSFVRLVLGGRNPIGRRLRYRLLEEWEGPRRLRDSDVWYEIVGVVPDLGTAQGHDPKVAGIYHPATVAGAYPAQVAVHVRGDPAALAPRLRALATEVDPRLRVYDLLPLDRVNDAELEFYAFWLRLLFIVTGVTLTLSLAGIYSVMAFTVARRTREIGVRVALGSSRRRVVLAVLRRPLAQVALGVVAGVLLVQGLLLMGDGGPTLRQVAILLAYGTVMLAVCLLACVVPTRRALRVQPTEALRADG
jgi:putative ABC transport system permease protein